MKEGKEARARKLFCMSCLIVVMGAGLLWTGHETRANPGQANSLELLMTVMGNFAGITAIFIGLMYMLFALVANLAYKGKKQQKEL